LEILNTRVEGPNIALIILGVVLIGIGIFILTRAIRYSRWKANATAFFCFLGFIMLLFLGIAVLRNNIGQNTTVYDVRITNAQDLQEVKRDFVIVRQSGKIYTIRPRKKTIDVLDEKIKEQ